MEIRKKYKVEKNDTEHKENSNGKKHPWYITWIIYVIENKLSTL